jgi:hypothetical protein
MNSLLRLLIALAISFSVMMLCTFISLQCWNDPNTNVVIGLTLFAGLLSFRYIKPKKQTDLDAIYWENTEENGNPIVKARGKTINNKREGEWDFFDEHGRYTETLFYENGEVAS